MVFDRGEQPRSSVRVKELSADLVKPALDHVSGQARGHGGAAGPGMRTGFDMGKGGKMGRMTIRISKATGLASASAKGQAFGHKLCLQSKKSGHSYSGLWHFVQFNCV